MTFRSIETLARDVLAKAKIEMQGSGSSYDSAPAPAYPVTGMGVATDAQREGKASAAFAQSGDKGTAEQTGMRKMAEPRSPAKLEGQEERQSEDRSRRGKSATLSSRKPMLTVLPAASASRHVSSARPTRCVGSHLKLVTVNGHAESHPIA